MTKKHVCWRDRLTNEVRARTRTDQQHMEKIFKERTLRWLGHVIMDVSRNIL